MLQWLDTLIGLVVVLLSVSLIIMIVTQMISALLNLRGIHLRKAIQILLENIEPDLKGSAKDISKQVLIHPLISDGGKILFKWKRFASTIRSEELGKILEVISHSGDDQWHKTLREKKQEIEKDIKIWMDKIMDRAASHFNRHTRLATVVFSLFLALNLHLDAPDLFKKISSDSELRNNLIASVDGMLEQTAVALADTAQDSTAIAERKKRIEKLQAEINKTGIELIPDPSIHNWEEYGKKRAHLWGVLVMAALLSLGAPFWFNTLKTFSSLRPILAGKENKERDAKTASK